MSEYVWGSQLHFTFCDRCHPVPPKALQLFKDDGSMEPDFPRGVFLGGFDLAATENWEERDYGQICPECVTADTEEQTESGNMVLGDKIFEELGMSEEPQEEEPP